MSESNELPNECDVCGEEEDPTGISDRVVIVGVCRDCDSVCCGSCLPRGAGTACLACLERDQDPDDMHPGDGHYFGD